MKKIYITIISLIIFNILSMGYIIYDKVLINNDINNNNINNDNKDTTNNKKYQDYEEIIDWNEEKIKIKYSFIENSNYESVINPTDTYVYTMQAQFGINFLILNNGIMYYNNKKCKEVDDVKDPIQCYTRSDEDDALIPYTEIINIKRMKLYNYGSSVQPALLLITEDGKVYSSNFHSSSNSEFKLVDDFLEYEVDDILSYNEEFWGPSDFEIILKDGTKVKKEVIYNENTES